METNWHSLGLRSSLIARLEEQGMRAPTDVQAAAVPALLEGKDVYARSHTGSGKTLAYLLPLLERIEPGQPDIQSLVLAPTQELAMQIVRVAERFGGPEGVRVQQLIGGAAVKRQLEKLKLKPHLVVGTPGRLHELLQMKKLRLHAVRAVVIDEADQMFALGSTKELEAVLNALPAGRQLAFFSATLPPATEQLAARHMREPARIDVAREQRVAPTIVHYAIVSEHRDKFETLKRLFHAVKPASALVFVEDTDQIANWEAKLSFEGFPAGSLYGDADKLRRSQTLDRFRDGRIRILLATDVAARGIDLEALQLVVNLNAPAEADRYVHRAGRTGRMGREGTVVTIVSPRELYLLDKLRRKLGVEIAERELYGGKLTDPAERRRGGRPAAGAERADRPQGAARRNGGALAAAGRAAEDRRAAAREPLGGARKPAAASEAARGAQPGADRPQAPKPRQAKPAKAASGAGPAKPANPAKAGKRERERAKKDKGAPKWLKAKREGAAKE